MADTVLTELKIHEFDSVEQMSQYESEIGENDMVYTPDTSIRLPILTPMWFDHQVNDESWLNADTFSWQSGDVYVAVYDHLASDINGKALQSEVIGDITVQFYLADDGHKICPASEESNLVALYEATGVAWYYILDTANKQFKLPRTKWGFTGLRDSVGGYVEPALPNIVGDFTAAGADRTANGAFSINSSIGCSITGTTSGHTYGSVGFNASDSSAIYKNGATVQPPATQMRLYFWVGAFDQTATEQTAGLNAEMFNGKADVGFGNVSNIAKELMANSSMPSGTYKDLTLGASGSTYTAPADGWFIIEKGSGGSGKYMYMSCAESGIAAKVNSASEHGINLFLPVKKGDVISVQYSMTGNTVFFRFVYAEGSKHLA